MMDQGRKEFTCPMITKKAGARLSAFSPRKKIDRPGICAFQHGC